MENKQTAVEWLVSNSYSFQVEIEAGNEHLKSKIEQAKQMEKLQIKYAYQSGCIGEVYELNCTQSAEEYYNENYGK